ncbi:MAG: metal ABC transporter solute-binding protein, Zn/Mn family [Egibacteraceae bacterium]
MTRRLALLFAAALLLAGCGQATEAEDATESVEDAGESMEDATESVEDAGAGVTAVTTVYPLAWMAETIAPEADLTYVGSRGQDPHDLELSPSDRALFETADVVLYMGDIDFQPQVEDAVSASTGEVVDATGVVGEDALLAIAEEPHDDHAEEGADDHADDEHTDDEHTDEGDDHADDEHADEGDEHADEGVDPHIWFDAGLMGDVATATGEAFAAADPDNADAYTANAQVVVDELTALDEEIDGLLSGCRLDAAIVSHEAYAYLLAPRDLEQEGISGAGGHTEATPQRIAELVEQIAEQEIDTVLTEPVEGRTDAEAVAREAADVELVEIYSLDIVPEELETEGYPTLLRQQAEAFAQALDCA